MPSRSVVTNALAILGLAASLAAPCLAQSSGEQTSMVAQRVAGPPVPAGIQDLARKLHVAERDLAELAVDGNLPADWADRLTNTHGLADAVAYGLGLAEDERGLFAGQVTNALLRIEREARKPRRATFAQLVDQVRRDARDTVGANLGDEAAGAAQALLKELAPLREHR